MLTRIFVTENGKDDRRAFVSEDAAPGLDEHTRAGRIVGAIDNDLIAAALEAGRPAHGRQPRPNRIVIDGDVAGA